MELEKLIEDVTFINWANGTNETDKAYWQNYLSQNPEEEQKLLTAKAMVINRRLIFNDIAEHQIEDDWSLLQNKIKPKSKKPAYIYLIIGGLAASILLITWFTLSRVSEVSYQAPWTEVKTINGEIKEITLPDGTGVILNANTTFSYNDQRNTKLNGEAYFNVVKSQIKPFQVQTKDARITVLGTSFNVKSRKEGSEIALNEGEVRFQNLISQEEVNLVAGEWAMIDDQMIKLSKKDLTSMTSWTKQVWIFNDTPISEVINRMEEIYGLEVTVKNKELLTKKITGKLSAKNPEIIYNALEGMLGLKINVNGTRVTLENPKD